MSNIPKEYPEVTTAEDKMNRLLSELAGLQSSYSKGISDVLTEIPKNQYHGTIVELCSDKGVLHKIEGKSAEISLGSYKSDASPGYEFLSCGSKRSDCNAPMATFKEYTGQLVEPGKSIGNAVDLMQAYNSCSSDSSCAGFTGMGESGPYKLVTSAASFTKEGVTPRSRGFVKNADITIPASSGAMSSKSLGIPTRVQYRMLKGVRGLDPDESATYTAAGGGMAGAAAVGKIPLLNPIITAPGVPMPLGYVEKALSAADKIRGASVIIGKTSSNKSGASAVPIVSLLVAPGWNTYVPENEFAAIAKLGNIPSGEIINSWVPGANSEKMKERCPITCDVSCGDYYFVDADNTVRPIAKSLKTCGKPSARIRQDMNQFLNDQGFKLDMTRPIKQVSDCEINLLGSHQKAKIEKVMEELMGLGKQVRSRVIALRTKGDQTSKETGIKNNEYNRVAQAYQGLESKMGSVLQVGDTMRQMTADFKSRAISQEGYQNFWMVLSVVVIAMMVYMARK